MKRSGIILIYMLFFVSGFSALIYQVCWQRALFTLLGSNIESTTIIVSIFMAGLGFGTLLGGYMSGRFSDYIIPVFAAVEILTGIYGFSSLEIIRFLSNLNSFSYSSIILCVSAMLILPTLLMGASFPLLTQYINRRLKSSGQTVAGLYFFNTIGASLASIVSVVVLFEFMGLKGTVHIAASLNIIIGTVVFSFYGWNR